MTNTVAYDDQTITEENSQQDLDPHVAARLAAHDREFREYLASRRNNDSVSKAA